MRNNATLSLNAIKVLERRYLKKDDRRKIIEAPKELFSRVARAISKAELNFKEGAFRQSNCEEKFFQMMESLEFMPNSPTLMNAGTKMGQLSACFVLPVKDSIPEIFKTLSHMAEIHKTGGGTGFDFSRLRPKGDLVSSTKGEASGPVSFMSIYDSATGVIVQGGRRRGANMGILRIDHPDIVEFIEAKLKEGNFSNFNLSVAVTEKFFSSVYKNAGFNLVNPRTGKPARKINSRRLLDLIVNCAWKTGDPGLIFIDEINRRNPVHEAGRIEATNPCGELPLLPYESCNLASINLSKFVTPKGSLDWKRLADR
ncbi:MAG: ribonucleotide reductase N-terminal alpha domain-containing protein, partial [Candidatus Omnitrophota bacterium]